MTFTPHQQVPPDFPRSVPPAAVGGAQPKLTGRLIDGKFVQGHTDEELFARYDICLDLVAQLTAYVQRKLAEQPGATVEMWLPKVKVSVEGKGWGLTADEIDWIMVKLAERLRPAIATGVDKLA